MPSWELQLIRRILEDKDFDTPSRLFGIDASYFNDSEAALVFDDIHAWWHDRKHYGQTPPMELIEERFPSLDLPAPRASLEALCDVVKQGQLRRRLEGLSDDLYDRVKDGDDPREALTYLVEETARLQQATVEGGEDIDFGATAADAIRQEVRVLESADGMLGFPWPWNLMNDETQGITDEGLFVFYGRPKSMKTWILSKVAEHMYTECEARLMVWCREMSPKQMRRRLACCIGEVDYGRYSKGRMTHEERTRLFRALDMVRDDEEAGSDSRLWITKGTQSDSDSALKSFAELKHKAEEFRPQVIVLDSAYHMQRSTKWRDIYELCRGLKNLAVDLEVPVLCTWQANRGGEKSKGRSLDEVALGDALAQEADFLARVLKRGTKKHPLLSLVVAGARETALEGLTINGVPASDFSFYSDQIIWEESEEEKGDKGPSTRRRRMDGKVVKYGDVPEPPEPDDYEEEEDGV